MSGEPACLACGAVKAPSFRQPYCLACGGLVGVPGYAPPRPAAWRAGPGSLWRWADSFPGFLQATPPVTLGEGAVPLDPLPLAGLPPGTLALRDDQQPTGSWKDRGTALVVAQLARELGPRGGGATPRPSSSDDPPPPPPPLLVEDSSGNAGLSLAHYARRAGLRVRLFVPARANPVRKDLIRAAGADLVEVDGPRDRATEAALEAVRAGAVYASHVAQPLHALGAGTAAFDIYEKLGRLPRTVVLPAGQGGYLAGLGRAFAALAGAVGGAPPRLVGVQSLLCAPLARAFEEGADDARPWPDARPGLAEGVLCPVPARAREALRAARGSGGAIVAADDLAVERALRLLWLHGLRVEPTSALPVAWLLTDAGRRFVAAGPDRRPAEPPDLVVILTGAGIRDGRQLFDAPA